MLTLILVAKVFGGAALVFLGYLVGIGIGVHRVERMKRLKLSSIAHVERTTESVRMLANVVELLRTMVAAETEYANCAERLILEMESAENDAQRDDLVDQRERLFERRLPIVHLTACVDRKDWSMLESVMHAYEVKVHP